MRLANKVGIITGSGMGIGRAEAIVFAKEGATVIVNDLNAAAGEETVALIKREGGNASFFLADVSKASEVEKLVQFAVETFGKLDVLINNAGIDLHGAGDCPVGELSDEVWGKTLNINLTGVFLCCKFAVREMLKQGGGTIINTASVSALYGTASHAYSASKGGVVALTRSIAYSYGLKNIRANVICPGYIETPMLHRVLPDPKVAARLLRKVPLGKFGGPEDIAYLALYLASDESAYITGDVFLVDGGLTTKY